ncbi:FkbM family methyltransferase [Sphingopyxis kveilinensis]|uniref:FkbM family methyltransferase n=1 Tax=Sphingopyxis kveilinensis TaxID=3114367 RepID=UPI0030D4D852
MTAINDIERSLARRLPTNFLKDVYPRAMRRLAEYGLFRGRHLVDTKHGFQIFADRLDAVKWHVYYFGELEPQVSLAWKRILRPGDSVLDIGANVGYHSLLAATSVGPQGHVYAVEPGRRVLPQLHKHIEINDCRNITVFENAISDKREVAKFYYGGDNLQGNSSLIGAETEFFDLVECITFADLAEQVPLEKLRLIKIDVEGAEDRVIRNMVGFLEKLRDDVVLFIEISPDNAGRAEEILKPFADSGFSSRLIENEYNTNFYRAASSVKLAPAMFRDGQIHDVVLSRDSSVFAEMAG